MIVECKECKTKTLNPKVGKTFSRHDLVVLYCDCRKTLTYDSIYNVEKEVGKRVI